MIRFSIAALVAISLLSASARADDECPLPDGASPRLSMVSNDARVAFLRDSLNHDARNANIWKWGWTAGYVVAAGVQLALSPAVGSGSLSPTFTKEDRNELYVGAISSAIPILPLVVLPLNVGWDGPTFDSQVAASKPGDVCAMIRIGESLVVRDAANEAQGAGWIMQIVNVAYNFAVAAILGWGFHYPWTTDLVAGVVGIAVGEGMILTQPTHLNDAWKTYQSGSIDKPAGVTVNVGPAPGSIMAVTGTF